MVAQCLAGSTAQAGAPAWFTYTESDLATFLPSVFGFVTYGLMGLPTGPQNTADFCSAEPVGDLPTAADYAKLAFPPLALVSGTYSRFGNQIRQNKFAELCQCNGGTGGPTNPCTTHSGHVNTSGYAVTACAFSPTCIYWGNGGPTSEQHFPTGQHHLKLRITNATDSNYKFAIYSSPSNTVLFSSSLISSPFTISVDAPVTDTVWQAYITSVLPGHQFDYQMDYWNAPSESSCSAPPFNPTSPPALTLPSGFPSAPAAPTCGSSQDVCNTLQTVLDKLSIIDLELTDIRSQNVPFSYKLGTAVTGLTGHGSISVSAALGCVVTLTTVPSGWGSTAETPRRLIPTACNIQGASAEGYSDWQQVHYEQQVVMWGHPWATSIQYNFRNGFVGTITPLIADRTV